MSESTQLPPAAVIVTHEITDWADLARFVETFSREAASARATAR